MAVVKVMIFLFAASLAASCKQSRGAYLLHAKNGKSEAKDYILLFNSDDEVISRALGLAGSGSGRRRSILFSRNEMSLSAIAQKGRCPVKALNDRQWLVGPGDDWWVERSGDNIYLYRSSRPSERVRYPLLADPVPPWEDPCRLVPQGLQLSLSAKSGLIERLHVPSVRTNDWQAGGFAWLYAAALDSARRGDWKHGRRCGCGGRIHPVNEPVDVLLTYDVKIFDNNELGVVAVVRNRIFGTGVDPSLGEYRRYVLWPLAGCTGDHVINDGYRWYAKLMMTPIADRYLLYATPPVCVKINNEQSFLVHDDSNTSHAYIQLE